MLAVYDWRRVVLVLAFSISIHFYFQIFFECSSVLYVCCLFVFSLYLVLSVFHPVLSIGKSLPPPMICGTLVCGTQCPLQDKVLGGPVGGEAGYKLYNLLYFL